MSAGISLVAWGRWPWHWGLVPRCRSDARRLGPPMTPRAAGRPVRIRVPIPPAHRAVRRVPRAAAAQRTTAARPRRRRLPSRIRVTNRVTPTPTSAAQQVVRTPTIRRPTMRGIPVHQDRRSQRRLTRRGRRHRRGLARSDKTDPVEKARTVPEKVVRSAVSVPDTDVVTDTAGSDTPSDPSPAPDPVPAAQPQTVVVPTVTASPTSASTVSGSSDPAAEPDPGVEPGNHRRTRRRSGVLPAGNHRTR